MLRNSLFLTIFLVNIFSSKIEILAVIFLIVIIANLLTRKKLTENLKKIRFILYIYLITFLLQIYYHQEGKVIFKLYNIYITQEAMVNFISNFLRIINMVILSWLINKRGRWPKFLLEYQEVFENVIDLAPKVFSLFKKKMKIKWFFRYILRQIKIKN